MKYLKLFEYSSVKMELEKSIMVEVDDILLPITDEDGLMAKTQYNNNDQILINISGYRDEGDHNIKTI